MKKILSTILCFTMIMSVVAQILTFESFADGLTDNVSGTTGKLQWSLTTDGVLTISGNGAMPGYNYHEAPWYSYYKYIISVVIIRGVNNIGKCAFYDCSSLTSVTIPKEVKAIGDSAFSGCSSLTNVTIPTGVTSIGDYAFSGCSSLTNVTIPTGVTSIGDYAFSGCSNLTNVTIPTGVTSIGDYAFCACSSLTNVTIPTGVTSIGRSLFGVCRSLTSVSLPTDLTSIPDSMFRGCTSLTSISIPTGVTSIESNAFSDCGLTSIIIPSTVTSIGGYAFSGCPNLISVSILASVKKIDRETFNGCSSLTSVVIPKGVTSIEGYAFSNCSSLLSVTIPSSVTYIDEGAFDNCPIAFILYFGTESQKDSMQIYDSYPYYSYFNSITWLCNYNPEDETTYTIGGMLGSNIKWSINAHDFTLSFTGSGKMLDYSTSSSSPWSSYAGKIKSVILGDGITSIGSYAFYGFSSITSVTIPTGVTSIGSHAFSGCKNLSSIIIPEGVNSISDYAFNECKSLTSITIPDGVTSISMDAFSKCSGLLSIILPKSVTEIQSCAFYYCKNLTSIIIPEGVKEIGGYAFIGCTKLKKVFFPKSLLTIGGNAFEGCESIETIYYAGTEKEKAKISISNGNDYLTFVDWMCNMTPEDEVYTVTWIVDGKETKETYKKGAIPSFKGSTEKAATAQYTYTFKGWDKDIATVTDDVTYTAIYTEAVNKYKVTYKNYDGTVLDVETVEYGGWCVYHGPQPNRDMTVQYCYEFSSWSASTNYITEDLTVYAQFDEITCVWPVYWVVDGKVTYEEYKYGAMPVFKGSTDKPGTAQYTYTFVGWDKTIVPVFSDWNKSTLPLSSDFPKYTAVYSQTVNKYTVKWVVDGKETTETYDYGETPLFKGSTAKAKTAQYTYTFNGWDKTITTVTGDVTYTATYSQTVNQYTVTYKNYDETVLYTDTVEYGSASVYKGVTPTKSSTAQYTYTFTSWSADTSYITSDITVYAQFSDVVNQFIVTWNVDDREIKETYNYGEIPSFKGSTEKAATAQYTYTFNGWDKSITVVTCDVTYTATYTQTVNKYTVKWIVDGKETAETYEYGATPSFKGSTAKAKTAQYTYTFNGWDKKITTVTCDETYTAVYTQTVNKYTVTYKNHDETVLYTDTVEYGSASVYKGVTPTKSSTAQYSYTFTSWSADTSYITADLTVYAQFSDGVNQFIVTWKVDSRETKETYNYGEIPSFKGSTEKAATAQYTYTFNGWDKTITAVTGDVTYTATYTQTVNKYTVKWIVDEKETTETYEYGATPSFKGSTVKAKTAQYTYTFNGWDKKITTVTGDETYTATYTQTVNKYTVTYKNYDGSVLYIDTVEYGSASVYKGATPTKPSTAQYTYTFISWSLDTSYIVADTIVVAQFSDGQNQFIVTWIVDSREIKETYNYGEIPSFKGSTEKLSTTQYTYTFSGWDKAIFYVTSDITYTAVYTQTVNKYTITWIVNGTETKEAYEYGAMPSFKGSTAKLSDDTYAYTFTGWDKTVVAVTGDATYTAQYSKSEKPKCSVNLTNSQFSTAWGVEFTTDIKATQLTGTGAEVVLTYDPMVVTYKSYKASSGVTVAVNGSTITISKSGSIASGSTLVSLTFITSDELISGEHSFITLSDSVNTASFDKLKIYEMGDVNMDGNINSRDVTMIKQYAVKIITLSEAQKVYANAYTDYDKSGAPTVSARDASIVTQYAVKMSVKLGDRVNVTFVNDDGTQIKRSVHSGATIKQIPIAKSGYAWSGSKTAFVAPVYANVTADKTFYLVKQ